MKKALVVGINDYPSIPLKGCIPDANLVGELLENNGDGSPNFDVKKAFDVSAKSHLKAMIKELFEGDSDVALFYFSGHGFLDGLGGYIVTPDFEDHDFGVAMDEILRMANNSKAKNKVIILDCCHSGKFGSSANPGESTTQINEGVTILTSSKDSEESFEEGGHGVFTSLLLDALRGGAADLRGNISPGSVYAHIDQALGPWDQRPVFKTNISRFISLRQVPPQVPIEILRKITEYFPSPSEQYQLNPSFEYTNEPNVEHKIIQPYAEKENVQVFKNLQKLESVGLVVPVDEDHMYFAAMNSKACKLTSLGYHYWKLVNNKRL